MMPPEYQIKRSSRARMMRITIDHKGLVTVTMPKRASEGAARHFVEQKSSWIRSAQEKMKERFDGKIFIRQSAADFAEKKAAALLLITEKAERFNAFYKFAYASIRIKNQRSRWGSCSSKGNLNFNYSLIYLPSHLADYVVVHELCHLKALNHGPSFWNLVKEAMPDYALRRRELRQKYVAYAVK